MTTQITGFSKEQTELLLQELITNVFKDNFVEGLENCEGNILWHFRAKNPFANKTIFDEDKNEYRVYDRDILISFEAGINKNGVGDGKLPELAMTYSVRLSVDSDFRMFRCSTWYESDYKRFYAYDRTIEGVLSKFKIYLGENIYK